jgi:cell division protein FtsX
VVLLALVILVSGCGTDGDEVADEDPTADLPPITAAPGTTSCLPGSLVVVFVNPAVAPEVIPTIEQRLRELPGVLGVTFIDQQAALEEFERLFAGQPELLEAVEPGQLPPSFRVEVDDPARVTEVEQAAESLDGVGQVVVPTETAEVTC